MEYGGVRWSSVEFGGVRWSTVEFGGVRWSPEEVRHAERLQKPVAVWRSGTFRELLRQEKPR